MDSITEISLTSNRSSSEQEPNSEIHTIEEEEDDAVAIHISTSTSAPCNATDQKISYKECRDQTWRRKFIEISGYCGLPIPSIPFTSSSSITTRVYQVWHGNNIFFFHGRVMFGPDPRGFTLTVASIVLCNWIFCIYVAVDLTNHYAFAILSSVTLTTTVMVNLVLVATGDPGIVPRNKNQLSDDNGSRVTRTGSMKVCINGFEMKLKYCRVCKIFRPPRTCHCAVCNNCVEKFDHHCPWVGQCIGLRNYRYYIMLLISGLVFFIYMFALSWLRIRRILSDTGSGICNVLWNVPETFALILFSFIAVLFLGGLLFYHAYLITQNQTAREHYKQQYVGSPNPYDKGIWRNINEILFQRLPPSKINFREVVEPDYSGIARLFGNSTGLPQQGHQQMH